MQDHKDDLDGLLLSVYENEIEDISKDVLESISYLTSIGFIEQIKNHTGKNWIVLSVDDKKVSEYISKTN
jgi:hypothetical protein